MQTINERLKREGGSFLDAIRKASEPVYLMLLSLYVLIYLIMKAYGARLAGDMTREKMIKAVAQNLIKHGGSITKYLNAVLLLYRAGGRDRAWATINSKDFWMR